MRMSRTTFVAYSVILILAAGLAVYALKPEMLRDIPFLSEILSPEDLTVNVRRSNDGKTIIIRGDSTFNYTEVKSAPVSISLVPTSGLTIFSSKPKQYDVPWTQYGFTFNPATGKVLTKGTYGFEMTIQVISVTDFNVIINVGDYSETFVSKSPVV